MSKHNFMASTSILIIYVCVAPFTQTETTMNDKIFPRVRSLFCCLNMDCSRGPPSIRTTFSLSLRGGLGKSTRSARKSEPKVECPQIVPYVQYSPIHRQFQDFDTLTLVVISMRVISMSHRAARLTYTLKSILGGTLV
jgi:hypothetical protein